jgi:hypothetical protein
MHDPDTNPLNTLQARVIDMKLYCDDLMVGAKCTTRTTRARTPLPHTTQTLK